MTSTLASLSGVPGATHPDGSPVYVERVRGQRNADLARCNECGYIVGDGQTWGLAQSVRLHTSGAPACQRSKVTYWRWL